MVEATDIEKKSLEAHVELCAERYNKLESRLDSITEHLESVTQLINDVKGCVHTLSEKRTDQIMGWGVAIIGFLVATCGWLITTYVLK